MPTDHMPIVLIDAGEVPAIAIGHPSDDPADADAAKGAMK